MGEHKQSDISDKVGITSALLCTVHCMAVPLLFVLKDWYAGSSVNFHTPAWWESIDYLFLAISLTAVYHSAAHTFSKQIKIALWVSWALLAMAVLMHTYIHWLAYFASAGLVTAHLINLRHIHKASVKNKKVAV